MLSVLLATSNRGKIRELQGLLSGQLTLKSPLDADWGDLRPPKVEEDGGTYYENALKKALGYYAVYQMPVLADDSGLELDALQGAPGVHSAYYGGENLTWAERWTAVHRALQPFPQSQWTGRFRSVLCFYDGKNVPFFAEGLCAGRLLPRPAGSEGFGYDPVFFSLTLQKSFGEATEAEKAVASHRAASVHAFLKKFSSLPA